MNSVIDSHAPFKMVDKYKLRLKTKSWITSAPQRSISVENALHNKFINSKKKTTQQKNIIILNIRFIEICYKR